MGFIFLSVAPMSFETAWSAEKQYLVEVALFEYRNQDAGNEIWKQVPLVLENDPNSLDPPEVDYVEKGPLKKAVETLERAKAYRLLLYSAWLQPALSKYQAPVISLKTTVSAPYSGSVRLYGGQLLFIDLTVQYLGDQHTLPWNSIGRQHYVISEKRRLKLNETHYFDHPYFGALIRVTRERDLAR